MTDTPQVTRGTGGDPNQPPLPQGEATQLNQAMESVPAAEGAPAAGGDQTQGGEAPTSQATPLSPVTMTRPPAMGPTALPGEEDNMLFGPTGRPGEHPATGGYAPLGTAPDGMNQWYPALHAAAQSPDTPQNVKDLFAVVNTLLARR